MNNKKRGTFSSAALFVSVADTKREFMNLWEARTAIEEIGNGRNHPFRARCGRFNDETFEEETGDFLVKAPCTGVNEARDFFHEIVGLRLARLLGINAPRAAVIQFDDDFIGDLKNTSLEQWKFESGDGTGCEFVHGLTPLTDTTVFQDGWLSAARLIYAFDALTGNDDRGTAKSNCSFLNSQLFAFDFERMFSGLERPAWAVCDQDFVARHIFHRHLMRSSSQSNDDPNKWDEFLGGLDHLDEARILG